MSNEKTVSRAARIPTIVCVVPSVCDFSRFTRTWGMAVFVQLLGALCAGSQEIHDSGMPSWVHNMVFGVRYELFIVCV